MNVKKKLLGISALVALALVVFAAPAVAAPELSTSIERTPQDIHRGDEFVSYKVKVTNTSSVDYTNGTTISAFLSLPEGMTCRQCGWAGMDLRPRRGCLHHELRPWSGEVASGPGTARGLDQRRRSRLAAVQSRRQRRRYRQSRDRDRQLHLPAEEAVRARGAGAESRRRSRSGLHPGRWPPIQCRGRIPRPDGRRLGRLLPEMGPAGRGDQERLRRTAAGAARQPAGRQSLPGRCDVGRGLPGGLRGRRRHPLPARRPGPGSPGLPRRLRARLPGRVRVHDRLAEIRDPGRDPHRRRLRGQHHGSARAPEPAADRHQILLLQQRDERPQRLPALGIRRLQKTLGSKFEPRSRWSRCRPAARTPNRR